MHNDSIKNKQMKKLYAVCDEQNRWLFKITSTTNALSLLNTTQSSI